MWWFFDVDYPFSVFFLDASDEFLFWSKFDSGGSGCDGESNEDSEEDDGDDGPEVAIINHVLEEDVFFSGETTGFALGVIASEFDDATTEGHVHGG